MPAIDNSQITAPLTVFVDEEGDDMNAPSVDIIDANGWHVCRMEELGELGERKAAALVAAFNAAHA
jgi:hypothetical protein